MLRLEVFALLWFMIFLSSVDRMEPPVSTPETQILHRPGLDVTCRMLTRETDPAPDSLFDSPLGLACKALSLPLRRRQLLHRLREGFDALGVQQQLPVQQVARRVEQRRLVVLLHQPQLLGARLGGRLRLGARLALRLLQRRLLLFVGLLQLRLGVLVSAVRLLVRRRSHDGRAQRVVLERLESLIVGGVD